MNHVERYFLYQEVSEAGNLKKHINAVHNGQKDHKCVTCGKQFSQAGTLKKHINSVYKVGHLLSELAIEFASELWCQILLSELTNKVSESRCRMWIESRFRQQTTNLNNGKKDRNCDSCGKLFSSGGHLKKHINLIHSGIKQYKLNGNAFSVAAQFRS